LSSDIWLQTFQARKTTWVPAHYREKRKSGDGYRPQFNITPIPDRPELEVDYLFENGKRPLYLFAVKDDNKGKLVTISCLEFLTRSIPFKSAVVYEDIESLSKLGKRLILSRTDKQFPDFEDFKANSGQFLSRELSG
jgi:hypothetical protein